MSSISLNNVVKQYGAVTIIDRLNLDVEEGEFIVLVGASGCGKSTTLRMIAGLETPTEGEIRIGGRDVTDRPPAERNIAMVFQSYALYPHMNVAQNMSFGLRLAGTPADQIAFRVGEAARILGIKHLLERKPKELSGGQRQRVAMGRAIVREPEVFLFDEPLSNLDAKLRGQMRMELALLHERLGKTIVYVTHDQVEAMTLADRIVVFDKGQIQQVGTPEEVFNRPRNLFVAGFIGSPTMNFLKARVTQDNGQLIFAGDGFDIAVPPQLMTLLRSRSNAEVIVGIRPQAFSLEPMTGASPIGLKVAVAEYLGTETHLLCVSPIHQDQKLTVVLPGQCSGLAHKPITLFANPDALLVFDPETEESVGPT